MSTEYECGDSQRHTRNRPVSAPDKITFFLANVEAASDIGTELAATQQTRI